MNYFPKQLELMLELYDILNELTDLWKGKLKTLEMKDVQIVFQLLGVTGELSHHYGSRDYWESKVKKHRFRSSLKYVISTLGNAIEILKRDFNEIYGDHIWKLAIFREKLCIELHKLDEVKK